jgi:zinc-finger of acetyl-transferase ESCO
MPSNGQKHPRQVVLLSAIGLSDNYFITPNFKSLDIFSLKEMLAKKKAFSVSISTDEDIVKIQSDVKNILKDLDDDSTHTEEKDSLSERLEKIDTLLTAASTISLTTCSSETRSSMGEDDMEMLIDNILGVETESSLQTNQSETDPDSGSRLDEFEQIINRMELSEETDDLFEDGCTDLKSTDGVKDMKLFPVFIKGATEKNQKCVDCFYLKPGILKIHIFRSLLESISSSKNPVIFPDRDTGDKEQYILDAGQKKYGQVECPGCQCVYDPDDRSDVEHHLQYHNRHKTTLKYLVNILTLIVYYQRHLILI